MYVLHVLYHNISMALCFLLMSFLNILCSELYFSVVNYALLSYYVITHAACSELYFA